MKDEIDLLIEELEAEAKELEYCCGSCKWAYATNEDLDCWCSKHGDKRIEEEDEPCGCFVDAFEELR